MRAIGDACTGTKNRHSSRLRRRKDKAAAWPVCGFVDVRSSPKGLTIKVIHQVKGVTYNAAVVATEGESRGRPDHLSQWLGIGGTAGRGARRVGYVAATRPRCLLVLAVPAATPGNVLARLETTFNMLIEPIAPQASHGRR